MRYLFAICVVGLAAGAASAQYWRGYPAAAYYQQPAYAYQQPYYQQPSYGYQQPYYQQTYYQQPYYQPYYQQPSYGYQQPYYQQPSYQQPYYQQPAYTYQQPSYGYQQPYYQQPYYQQSSYGYQATYGSVSWASQAPRPGFYPPAFAQRGPFQPGYFPATDPRFRQGTLPPRPTDFSAGAGPPP